MRRALVLLVTILIGAVSFFGWRAQKDKAALDDARRQTASGINKGGEFDEAWLDGQRHAGNL